jgi:hypothetical protein
MSNVFSKRLVYLWLTFLWTSVYLLSCLSCYVNFMRCHWALGTLPLLKSTN